MSEHTLEEINYWETRLYLERLYHEARMNKLLDIDKLKAENERLRQRKEFWKNEATCNRDDAEAANALLDEVTGLPRHPVSFSEYRHLRSGQVVLESDLDTILKKREEGE